MSGFVATAETTSQLIANDGFWPDVDAANVRDVQRFDGTVSDARLIEALTIAIGSINAELADWQAAQVALGVSTLADVPAPKVGGISRYVNLYLRAVRCTAAAHIVERYRNFDVTNSGQKNADEQTPSIDELRRDARWAIRDILGLSHSTVELI